MGKKKHRKKEAKREQALAAKAASVEPAASTDTPTAPDTQPPVSSSPSPAVVAPPATEFSATGIIALFLSSAGVIAALFYIAGWAYAYNYFSKFFNIGLLSLSVPNEYYYLYGFWVMRESWAVILLCVIALYALAYLVWKYVLPLFCKKKQATRKISLKAVWLATGLPAVMMLFTLGYCFGEKTAVQHYGLLADRGFPEYHSVEIEPANEGKLPAELTRGCYQLVLRNAGDLYLIRAYEQPVDERPTLVVPMSQVKTMRILPRVFLFPFD